MKSLTWKVCTCVYVFEDSRNALLLAELLLENTLAQRGQGFADESRMKTSKVSGPRCRNIPVSGILPGPGPAVSVSKVGLDAEDLFCVIWFDIGEEGTRCFLTDQTSRCHFDKRQRLWFLIQ